MTQPTQTRFHDLDALRAFAMLLGIALHAALSFMDIPWIVQDTHREPALKWFVSAIHGFRMPLFFLLSGFFTVMLWQKRGTRGLLKHRYQRIARPLMWGCATIVPVMWGVIIWAAAGNTPATASNTDTGKDIWTAAAFGDMDALRIHAENGAPINGEEPIFGHTPLGWAVLGNNTDAVQYLLESGADASTRYRDNNTALHTAAFFGRTEAVKLLLQYGAEINATNIHNETPIDSLRHDQGTTEFIAGLVSVPIDFKTVEQNRIQIHDMLTNNYASSGLESIQLAESQTPEQAQEPLSARIHTWTVKLMEFPFFHHLWFLWHLCILVIAFAIIMTVARYIPRVSIPTYMIATPLCLFILVPVTMLTQSFMQKGGSLPGFGPDTSVGLIPMPHVLAHYAIFYAFGAIMYAVPSAAQRLSRSWWLQLPLAVLLAPVTLALAFQTPWGRELAGSEPTRILLSNLGQVLYAWLMIFGLMGLFGKLLGKESYTVRYVSDSSYWLYLIHLPLIIVGQALLRNLDLPASIKITLLIAITTAILLISYRYLVRYTRIGRLLNGPRTRLGAERKTANQTAGVLNT